MDRLMAHKDVALDDHRRYRHLSMARVTSELHRLCRSGDLSAIKSYLNEVISPTVINKFAGENGCTPLHEAAMAGREDVVRLLKEECRDTLDMDARTQRGPASTSLHLASERGHAECVVALLECGASLEAVDRRCRNAKDVAKENGKRQVVQVITLVEMERAADEVKMDKLKEALSQLRDQSLLSESVRELQQEKLNGALLKVSMAGNYKIVVPLVEAGANNFAECIQKAPRLNHILAFLRLCQAANEDDRTTIQLLLEQNEDEIVEHSLYTKFVQYRQILMPLLDNGKLSVGTPIRVALLADNVLAAGNVLLRFSKHPSSGMVDWHGLDLEFIPGAWIKAIEYPNLNFISFSFNKLKQIPSEVTGFKTIVKLQVASNQLTFVSSEILELPALEHLDLSFNAISSLPEALLGELSPVLAVVNISHNRLTSLPAYFESGMIRDLDISHNYFSEVPKCVCALRHLQSLNISHNIEISRIPYGIGNLKHMQVLSLEGLPYILNIPPRQECLPLQFLKKRYVSMQTVPHFELQMVGSPQSEKIIENFHSTFSLSKLPCSILHYNNPTQFLYLHKVFQLSSTVYLVVWDCHNQQHPNSFHRVLRHLTIFAPGAPIVLAACWKDDVTSEMEKATQESISQSLWKDIRGQVQVQHVELESGDKEDRPYSVLNLVKVVEDLGKKVETTFFIPRSYYEYTKLLPRIAKERLETETKPPMLKQYDFFSLVCSMPTHDISSNKELPELVAFLARRGILLHIPCNQTRNQSLFMINRQWFCDVLGHAVSHTSDTMGYRNFTGIVRQEGLIDLLDCPTLTHEIPDALRLFVNHHSIAIAFSSTQWLVPSMLDTKPDPTVPSFFSQFGIRKQYTFGLTPITFWGRLITHLVINLENYPREIAHEHAAAPVLDWSYWATGMICSLYGTELLYCIEAIKTSAEPFMEGLEIRAPNTPKGSHMMQIITFTVESLLRNWYPTLWRTVEIWVPCSYCIHRRVPDIPSISFSDALQAVSKGVGVKCSNHPEKVVAIAKVIPDLFQHKMSKDYFIPPGKVEFNPNDRSTCLSPPNSETVFKGKYNGSLVAIKLYPHPVPNLSNTNADCTKSNTLALLEMWQECQALQKIRSINCPYLVNLLGMCQSPLCLVFPFAKWSSLEDVIQDKEIYIPLMVRIRMLQQLTAALQSIHSQHMIHRHVCLANILVTSLSPDEKVNIKLAGFSEACHAMFQGISKGYHGTFPAPEMSEEVSSNYDERVDMFAFAFVAYEIITRHRIHTNSRVSLLKVLFHPVRPTLAPIAARLPYFASLIDRCWDVDPTKRPFASDVAEYFRDPVNILTRDGRCISENHGFFAGAAKFTRTQHSFSSDIFLCSGALSGETEEATLSHLSLSGLSLNRTATIPSLFIICMCCIGNQLWVSIYGKKVLVYSTVSLKFQSEFSFKQHVVAMAVSPTQMYLGLENGVLQVYDVSTNIIPTEPFLTKVVSQGKEFKCIEPLEDCVLCATRDTIYKLHPDLLHHESKWPIVSESDIRNVVMTRFLDDDDTIWISFRRLDRIEVRNAKSGNFQYTIECSRVVQMMSNKVWVVTMRVVLDTVWIGLNTGHILIFNSSGSKPQILTHFKLHKGNVRQLLLLHPSYMGPASIQVTGETLPPNSSTTHPPYAEQVHILSCGEGLVKQLPGLNENGTLREKVERENAAETDENKDDLYAVILEGMCESRVADLESNTGRAVVAYSQPQDIYYSVPSRGTCFDDAHEFTNPAYRTSTWSAASRHSPIESKMTRMSSQQPDDEADLYESIRHMTIPEIEEESESGTANGVDSHENERDEADVPPPPLPPRDEIVRNLKLSPIPATKRLPRIAEGDGEGSNEKEDSYEWAELGQRLPSKSLDKQHVKPAPKKLTNQRTQTVPNLSELSKTSAPRPTSRSLLDSCEDDSYDPYVSMSSVLQVRQLLKQNAEIKEPTSATKTGSRKSPKHQKTPPPLPEKPKMKGDKRSPPLLRKRSKATANNGVYLEQH